MEAAHMTFAEEVIKLRAECKDLRIANTNHKKRNDKLTKKVEGLEQRDQELRQQNQLLKQKQQLLIEKQSHLEKTIESLKLIVEELRRIVFGKKKAKKDGDNSPSEDETENNLSTEEKKERKNANRTAQSYRRDAPTDAEITNIYEHLLTQCPDCGTLLTEIKAIIRYVEDLQNLEQLQKFLKKIEKHIIGSGYCARCKKRKIAQTVSPQVSILGDNIKKFVCYLSIVMRLSFEQIKCFLKDTANFAISDGEITSCLDNQAKALTPEKDRLLQKIRGAPGRHYDETGWKVQKTGQGKYCWISRPTEGEEAVFLMGRSRGKGNAKELQGADNQVGISDDYAGYDNLFEKHQLCMSHPHRKLRDLHEAKTLSEETRKYCTKSHQAFARLYAALEKTLATKYQKDLWLKKRDAYIKQLKKIAIVTRADPQKLKAIKQALTQNAEKYFTCLLQPGIPADNNKAERGLRHIVLKRKISYGSKSQKGADTMSILCSTLLSCWWNKPKNFFFAYNQMLTS